MIAKATGHPAPAAPLHRLLLGALECHGPSEPLNSVALALACATSRDGSTWESIDTSQIPATFAGFNHGASGWGAAGNRLFVSSSRDKPALARLWILDFEPSENE